MFHFKRAHDEYAPVSYYPLYRIGQPFLKRNGFSFNISLQVKLVSR